METTHLVFLEFACGHEYYFARVPGGVSDWENCLCNSCQPYHAVLTISHRCGACGGSFDYLSTATQIQLSEQEAALQKKTSTPLFSALTFDAQSSQTVKIPCTASLS